MFCMVGGGCSDGVGWLDSGELLFMLPMSVVGLMQLQSRPPPECLLSLPPGTPQIGQPPATPRGNSYLCQSPSLSI